MTEQNGTTLLQSFSNAVAQLTDEVSASVVRIVADDSLGSGIVWDEGHVLTAAHVVGGATSTKVVMPDGKELEAKVVGVDRETDVAVLDVGAGGAKAIGVGKTEQTRVGQFVLALANAFGRTSATSGIVTSRGPGPIRGWRGAQIEDAIVTDAKLNPGYSGGPLVDASGRMLGMNVAFFASRGIAVSVERVQQVATALLRDGKVKRGFLGVHVEQIELPVEVAGEVAQEEGLLVRSVDGRSPAKEAGLAIGDIILVLGGEHATDRSQLRKALSAEAIGKTLDLRILRGGKIAELKVRPTEVPDQA